MDRSRLYINQAVIFLLGFEGFEDLALRSGLSTGTVRRLLGHDNMAYSSWHSSVIVLHEALHTAFVSRRTALLRPGQIAFIVEWANEWRAVILDRFTHTHAAVSPSPEYEGQRNRLRKNIVRRVSDSFEALQWEVR